MHTVPLCLWYGMVIFWWNKKLSPLFWNKLISVHILLHFQTTKNTGGFMPTVV
jgi:hypothetical protein